MKELKVVLENLNSALDELQKKITEVDTEKKELNAQKIKQDELNATLDKKAKDIDVRTEKIAEIESIVDFAGQAKKLMADAKVLMKNAEERQEILEKGLKQLTADKAKFEIDCQIQNDGLKMQADAIKKERSEINAQTKALKGLGVTLK